jgi:16S rRNA (uracil1498-N3)-methyltransferase
VATGVMRLPEGPARHLVRVLRHQAGDALRVFDGEGREFEARIESVERGEVRIRVGEALPPEPPPQVPITLLQGVARGDRMDLVLQKATELGVARITPLLLSRSTVKLGTEGIARRHEHWLAVVSGACEQCGRSRLPLLDTATTLDDALRAGQRELKLLLEPAPAAPSLPSLLATHPERVRLGVRLLVGPEGGFDEGEIALALAAGYVACRMGARTLRTETAGLVAAALVQGIAGDLR